MRLAKNHQGIYRMAVVGAAVSSSAEKSQVINMSRLLLVWVACATHVSFAFMRPLYHQHAQLFPTINDTIMYDGGYNLLGRSLPKFLKRATKKSRVPTVNSPFDPHYFVAPIRIGYHESDTLAPGRSFKMIFDTTASDTLVMSEGVKDQQYEFSPYIVPGDCTRYQPRSPTYYAASGTPSTLRSTNAEPRADQHGSLWDNIGSGYDIGYKATDSVKIGAMILKDVELGVVDYIHPETVCLRGSDYDGVIGLNLRALGSRMSKEQKEGQEPGQEQHEKEAVQQTLLLASTTTSTRRRSTPVSNVISKIRKKSSKKRTSSNGGDGGSRPSKQLFDVMMKQKYVSKSIVSVYMSPEEEGGKMGQVIFGGVDKQLYSGNMTFFPIIGSLNNVAGAVNHDWKLRFDSIRIGSNTVIQNFVARFESTYQYGIYSPHGRDLSTAIMNKAPGAQRVDSGEVVIECDKRGSLPSLVLLIGNTEFSFKGEEYFPFRSKTGHIDKDKKKQAPGNLCHLFVEDPYDGQDPRGEFGLGVPFMRKYYTALDATAGKIGLALAKSTTQRKSDEKKRSRLIERIWNPMKKLQPVKLPNWMKKNVNPGSVPKWVNKKLKKASMPKWMKKMKKGADKEGSVIKKE